MSEGLGNIKDPFCVVLVMIPYDIRVCLSWITETFPIFRSPLQSLEGRAVISYFFLQTPHLTWQMEEAAMGGMAAGHPGG